MTEEGNENFSSGGQPRPTSATDLPDASDDIDYLRRLLGSAFVDWVLAEPSGALTPAQLEVASQLAQILRQNINNHPELPIEHIIPNLAFYHQASGTTLINYARQFVGGTVEKVEGDTGDRLLNAFLAFAAECYGELLLPGGPFRGSGPDFHNYYRTPVGKTLVDAIIDARILPREPDLDYSATDSKTVDLFRSHLPGMFASNLIRCAWNLAKLHHGTPSLAQLLEQIPNAVRQLQSLMSGRTTPVTALASLTGACLPPGIEITGSWGRIRSARTEDHPPAVKHLIDKRTVTTTDTGDHVEISDAGDIIFETSVRVKFKASADGSSWSSESVDDFGELLDRMRLAFVLAVARPAKPVIFCMWARTLTPLFSMEPRPFTDPNFMAMRIPTLLSDEEIASWERWTNIMMAEDVSHLRVAMTRTLRAMTERRDPYDRLIDAVIAWESLFGGSAESTLRVSVSLARMLHPAGQDREAASELYRKIYGARSDIVHANRTNTTIGEIEEYGRTAIDVSLKIMASILTTHKALLPLRSSTRSTRVLLGADSMATDANVLPQDADPRSQDAG